MKFLDCINISMCKGERIFLKLITKDRSDWRRGEADFADDESCFKLKSLIHEAKYLSHIDVTVCNIEQGLLRVIVDPHSCNATDIHLTTIYSHIA
jgi:hypothetical protein